jgi:hypothetical protein
MRTVQRHRRRRSLSRNDGIRRYCQTGELGQRKQLVCLWAVNRPERKIRVDQLAKGSPAIVASSEIPVGFGQGRPALGDNLVEWNTALVKQIV